MQTRVLATIVPIAFGIAATWGEVGAQEPSHLDRVSAAPAAKESALPRAPHAPGARVHPALEAALATSNGEPVRVGIWLDFDPRHVDHIDRFRAGLRNGLPRSAARAELLSFVREGNLISVQSGVNLLTGLGLPVLFRGEYAPVVFTEATAEQVAELARSPLVDALYPDLQAEPQMASAHQTHRWDRVFDFGVRGDGIRVAVIEGGAIDTAGTGIDVVGVHLPGHPIDDHATAVAAVLGSVHPVHPGYARGVDILNANMVDGSAPAFIAAGDWAIGQGADVLHTSLGWSVQLQLYITDRYADYVVRYLRVTFTVSAGSAGLTSGNVKSPGLAWNVITVGSTWDKNNGDWNDDEMADESSYQDPVSLHGDREKPEVAAVGTNLDLVGAGATVQTWSGTSFAAPTVAGVAACLMQVEHGLAASGFPSSPEALKAIVMATAMNNIEGHSRLSEKDGAGCINGLQALRVAEARQFEIGTFYPSLLSSDHKVNLWLRGGDLFRAVLCWNSDADSSYGNDDLEADLDLSLHGGLASTSGPTLAASTSWDNSYEIVEFCPPESGWYSLWVHAVRFDGVNEPYGLAWTQHADGRYPRFRPHYPEVYTGDAVGPVIGNSDFRLDPLDVVNPWATYVCVASEGTGFGIPLAGCRLFPLDYDPLMDLSLSGGSTFFDFFGSFDAGGAGPLVRMAIPDNPKHVGKSFQLGMVTMSMFAPDMVKEISVPEPIFIESHSDAIHLSDDGSVAINIPFEFWFYGKSYTLCFVNANGSITFGGGDDEYSESVAEMLGGLPRIAPFWDDLDPAQGGLMRARHAGSRLIIEWQDVPEHNFGNQNSVITVLREDATIEFLYRDCALGDAIVGISPGGGAAGYETDLSHGSRYPNPIFYFNQPAIYEVFSDLSNPFDLGVADDIRNTVRFTPTGLEVGNFRVTVDLH